MNRDVSCPCHIVHSISDLITSSVIFLFSAEKVDCENGKTPASCICSELRREIKVFTTTWQIGRLLINTEAFTSACFKHFQTAFLCFQMCTGLYMRCPD